MKTMTTMTRDTKKDVALAEDSLRQPLDSLVMELGRISAEIQSINSGFQAQMQQALAETRAEMEHQYREWFEKSVNEMREQFRIEKDELQKEFRTDKQSRIDFVQKEIQRITAQLEIMGEEIRAMLDDSSVELSKVIQKRTQQSELQVYLNGLHFAVADATKTKGANGG